jgi:TRAP-type mannitol/chloroaromatic compound transport system permease small subunit
MFGALVLLAAPWTLASNEHIRIDILSSRLTQHTRNIIELVGHSLFLIPVALVLLITSWEFFELSYGMNEQSSNAGGLALWPPKFLIPLGSLLLLAQGVSELIKRICLSHRALMSRIRL